MVTETNGDTVVVLDSSGEHLHEPDPRKVDEIKFKNAVKRKAQVDSGPPARISRTVAADFPSSVHVRVSSEAQRKLVRRSRPLPTTNGDGEITDDFEVPEPLQRTLDGAMFYQGNIESDEGGKALLFASHEDLRRLNLSRFWIADGTFDTVPGCFRQLFTIHASVGPDHKHTVPVVYVLMTNKSENLYKDVLAKVSEVASNIDIDLAPKIILTDFEKGIDVIIPIVGWI